MDFCVCTPKNDMHMEYRLHSCVLPRTLPSYYNNTSCEIIYVNSLRKFVLGNISRNALTLYHMISYSHFKLGYYKMHPSIQKVVVHEINETDCETR